MDEQQLSSAIRRYYEIHQEILALSEEKNVLNEAIKDYLVRTQKQRIKSNIGTFSIKETKRWRYTDEVAMIKEELQAAMKEEQEKGLATSVVSKIVSFREAKTDTDSAYL